MASRWPASFRNIGSVVFWPFVRLLELFSLHNFAMRSRLGGDRPSMFSDIIVIVEGIITVVEPRYDLYSWYSGTSLIRSPMGLDKSDLKVKL